MKAIVIREFGPPDVLKYEDVPDPSPRAGEIRIRVCPSISGVAIVAWPSRLTLII